jgi:hypothetical protein
MQDSSPSDGDEKPQSPFQNIIGAFPGTHTSEQGAASAEQVLGHRLLID